ncbi:hypothetical protein SDC9_184139 [bioreactor metagenome]|uniref:Uncharacterized protein n=1 Tax=bioreactor metagenome TaxID=1076179 RepID=A0A645HER6_9ZZZZ
MEDRALQLVLFAQLGGVGQVAVVPQRHAALDVPHHQRLRVGAAAGAGGGVAAMPHCHFASAQRLQFTGAKHLVHKANVFMQGKHPVVVDRNAAAFLPAVLQCIQTIVTQRGHVQLLFARKHPKNAAFLMQLFCLLFVHAHSPKRRRSTSR